MRAYFPSVSGEGKRQRDERLRRMLDEKRSYLQPDWQLVKQYILPGRGRFNSDPINRRADRSKIIDSTGTLAARSLSAGFMAHLTSPAREWRELTIPDDPDLSKWGPVKRWLEAVNDDMSAIFRSSGFYKMLPEFYKDAAGFGTGAYSILEDMSRDRVIRPREFAIGSYYLANDKDGRAVVFMRTFPMTIRQLLAEFAVPLGGGRYDLSNFSAFARGQYEQGNYDVEVEVTHVIQPNELHDDRKFLPKYKKFSDCYYETGAQTGAKSNYMAASSDDNDRYLRESGHDVFPIVAGKWSVTDGDSYGTDCPGFTALGDIRALQKREIGIARSEELVNRPPMVAQPTLKTVRTSSLPGDITYDPSPTDKVIRPMYQIQPRIDFSEEKQKLVRARINEAFFVNLFLAVSKDERNDRGTAYEWSLRKQEELAILGPVVENFSFDVLDPTVELVYHYMALQGRLPPPPEELAKRRIGVRYVSAMAQAQKATGLNGLERFLMVSKGVADAAGDPNLVRDKLNIDEIVNHTAEMTGVSANVLRDDEDAQASRDAREKQQSAAVAGEQLKASADAARNLAAADTEGKNALTDIIGAATAGQ